MSFEDVNDCQLFQENPHSLAFLWWPCWWLWRIPGQKWMCPRWKQCGLSSVAAELFIFNKQYDWSFEKLPGRNQPANFEVALKPPAGTFRVPGPTGLSFSVVRSILGLQTAQEPSNWHWMAQLPPSYQSQTPSPYPPQMNFNIIPTYPNYPSHSESPYSQSSRVG